MSSEANSVVSTRPNWFWIAVIVALVLSMGGVSYATNLLPKHSVGPAQLKANSVGPRSISFPVGGASTTKFKLGQIVSTGFCAGVEATPCLPPTPNRSVKTSIRTKTNSLLHISGTVAVRGVGQESAPDGRATATAKLSLDGNLLRPVWAVSLGLDQESLIPVDITVPVRKGPHRINYLLAGTGTSLNVESSFATISVQAVPKAPK